MTTPEQRKQRILESQDADGFLLAVALLKLWELDSSDPRTVERVNQLLGYAPPETAALPPPGRGQWTDGALELHNLALQRYLKLKIENFNFADPALDDTKRQEALAALKAIATGTYVSGGPAVAAMPPQYQAMHDILDVVGQDIGVNQELLHNLKNNYTVLRFSLNEKEQLRRSAWVVYVKQNLSERLSDQYDRLEDMLPALRHLALAKYPGELGDLIWNNKNLLLDEPEVSLHPLAPPVLRQVEFESIQREVKNHLAYFVYRSHFRSVDLHIRLLEQMASLANNPSEARHLGAFREEQLTAIDQAYQAYVKEIDPAKKQKLFIKQQEAAQKTAQDLSRQLADVVKKYKALRQSYDKLREEQRQGWMTTGFLSLAEIDKDRRDFAGEASILDGNLDETLTDINDLNDNGIITDLGFYEKLMDYLESGYKDLFDNHQQQANKNKQISTIYTLLTHNEKLFTPEQRKEIKQYLYAIDNYDPQYFAKDNMIQQFIDNFPRGCPYEVVLEKLQEKRAERREYMQSMTKVHDAIIRAHNAAHHPTSLEDIEEHRIMLALDAYFTKEYERSALDRHDNQEALIEKFQVCHTADEIIDKLHRLRHEKLVAAQREGRDVLVPRIEEKSGYELHLPKSQPGEFKVEQLNALEEGDDPDVRGKLENLKVDHVEVRRFNIRGEPTTEQAKIASYKIKMVSSEPGVDDTELKLTINRANQDDRALLKKTDHNSLKHAIALLAETGYETLDIRHYAGRAENENFVYNEKDYGELTPEEAAYVIARAHDMEVRTSLLPADIERLDRIVQDINEPGGIARIMPGAGH